MVESKLDIIQAIEIAMQEELAAAGFYNLAMKKVKDERAIMMLNQLVRFEQHHYEKLVELRNSLEADGKFIKYDGIEFALPPSTPEAAGRIEDNKIEILDILSIAIKTEENAKNKYLELVERTDIPEGKEMFTRLAKEEEMHWRILSDEHYHLTNDGMWGI